MIFATNFAVQHGLMHVSANRAIVLLLSELVVAALSSYFLALEAMRWNQWAGGAMIVAATLLSGRLGGPGLSRRSRPRRRGLESRAVRCREALQVHTRCRLPARLAVLCHDSGEDPSAHDRTARSAA